MIRLIPRLAELVSARYPGRLGLFYQEAGLTNVEWSRLRRGQRQPSLKQLQRIARTFKNELPELWLLEEDNGA